MGKAFLTVAVVVLALGALWVGAISLATMAREPDEPQERTTRVIYESDKGESAGQTDYGRVFGD